MDEKLLREDDAVNEDGSRRLGGITIRAGVVGLMCVAGIAVAGSVSAYLRYDLIGTGHLPRSALYPILVIVLINFVMRRFFARRGMSRSEMLFIYCTILVMTGIPGQQFANYLYLGLVGPIYYATPQNQYADPVHGFHQHINDWLVPSKDPNDPVIRWMFEGLPEGAGFTDIPWGLWVRPLLIWSPFAILIFFVTLCIASLLRRQWVERERLLFPLAQIPLEVSKTDEDGGPGPVFRSKAMWIAFCIPVIIYGLNGLHQYFPVVPEIDLRPQWMQNLFADKPWYVLNHLETNFYFCMIGISYLLTAEVGFSFWFFCILERILQMVRITFGWEQHNIFKRNMHVGSFLVAAAFFAWVGRGHIRDVIRKAFGRAPDIDDSDEPLSYRVAFFGATGGFALICAWCWFFGLSIAYPIFMFGWYFLSLVVLTRIVAEAGLFVFWFGIDPHDMTLLTFGYGNATARNASLLHYTGFQIRDAATSLLPQSLQAMKIATEAKLSRRKVFAMMMVAIVIAVFACHIPTLWVTYSNAVPNLGWWTRNAGRNLAWGMEGTLVSTARYRQTDVFEMFIGGGITMFLLFMRQRFLWWPFHPLGFVANTTWTMNRYWFAMFLGWSVKMIVTWLGGVRLWRKLYPAAIGLIIGNAFILFTWLLIHFIWPIRGVLLIE